MNRIVKGRVKLGGKTAGGLGRLIEDAWDEAMHDTHFSAIREAQERAKAYQDPSLVQVAEGFNDAVVSVNEPPPQHDWSDAMARLERLREEDAGLKSVDMAVTISITGQPSWTFDFQLLARNEAESARRSVRGLLDEIWNAFTKQPRSKATFVVSEKHE